MNWIVNSERHVHAVFSRVFGQGCHGGLFVDAGANAGFYGVLAASYGCEVVFFEPQPLCVNIIQRNLCLNGHIRAIAEGRFGIIPEAIAADPTPMVMAVPPLCRGSFSVKTGLDATAVPGPRTNVTTHPVSLDAVFDGISIFMIKIDTEGFEVSVLKTAMGMLRSKRVRHLLIEVAPVTWQRDGIISRAAAHETFAALLELQCTIKRVKQMTTGARVLQQTAAQFKWVQFALSFKGTTCAELGGADFIDGLRIAGRNDMREALTTAGITGFNVRASSRDCIDTSLPSFAKLAQTLIVLSYNGTTNLEVRNALWNAARERICTGGYNRVVWGNVAGYLGNKDALVAFNNASRLNPSGNAGANQMPYVPAAGGCGTPTPSPSPAPTPSPSPAPGPSPSPAPTPSPSPAPPASPSPAPESPSPSPEPASPSPAPTPSPSPAPALNCSAIIPGSTNVNGTCVCAAPNTIPVVNAAGNVTQCLPTTTTSCPTGTVSVKTSPGALVSCLSGVTTCPSGYPFFLVSGTPTPTLQECRPATTACIYSGYGVPITNGTNPNVNSINNQVIGCTTQEGCPASYPVAWRDCSGAACATLLECRNSQCPPYVQASVTAFTVPQLTTTGQLVGCFSLPTLGGQRWTCPATAPYANYPIEAIFGTLAADNTLSCSAPGTICLASSGTPNTPLTLFSPIAAPVPTECRSAVASCTGVVDRTGATYTIPAYTGSRLDGCVITGAQACPTAYPFTSFSAGNVIQRCDANGTAPVCSGTTPVPVINLAGQTVACTSATACPANYPIKVVNNNQITACLQTGSTCPVGNEFILWGGASVVAPIKSSSIQECWPTNWGTCSGFGSYPAPIFGTADATGSPIGCAASTVASGNTCPPNQPFVIASTIGDIVQCRPLGLTTCPVVQISGVTYSVPAFSIPTSGASTLVGCSAATATVCPLAAPVRVRATAVDNGAVIQCITRTSRCPLGYEFFLMSWTAPAAGSPVLEQCSPYPALGTTACTVASIPTLPAGYTAVSVQAANGALQGCTTQTTVCPGTVAGTTYSFSFADASNTLVACRPPLSLVGQTCSGATQFPAAAPVTVGMTTSSFSAGVLIGCSGSSTSCPAATPIRVYTTAGWTSGAPLPVTDCISTSTPCPAASPFILYGGGSASTASVRQACTGGISGTCTGVATSGADAYAAKVFDASNSLIGCVTATSTCPSGAPFVYFKATPVNTLDACAPSAPAGGCAATGAAVPPLLASATLSITTQAGALVGCAPTALTACPTGPYSYPVALTDTAGAIKQCVDRPTSAPFCNVLGTDNVQYSIPISSTAGATSAVSADIVGCAAAGTTCPTTFPFMAISASYAIALCSPASSTKDCATNGGAFTTAVQSAFSSATLLVNVVGCLDGAATSCPTTALTSVTASVGIFDGTTVSAPLVACRPNPSATTCAAATGYTISMYNQAGTAAAGTPNIIGCVKDASTRCPSATPFPWVAGANLAGMVIDSCRTAAAASTCGDTTFANELYSGTDPTVVTQAALVGCISTNQVNCPQTAKLALVTGPGIGVRSDGLALSGTNLLRCYTGAVVCSGGWPLTGNAGTAVGTITVGSLLSCLTSGTAGTCVNPNPYASAACT
ncbi:hypothetical protein HT031_006234 [Scenedesmus sp. PABB004]|nr:hypothetical protein HT031_006234 [Scenedesmus sp. PABB004]